MADFSRLFRRARLTGRNLAQGAPSQARQAADEVKRTAEAMGEALDGRTGGRFGEALARGGEVVDRVKGTPGEVREAFREEAGREGYRPEPYRPDPIEPPAPIERPDPL